MKALFSFVLTILICSSCSKEDVHHDIYTLDYVIEANYALKSFDITKSSDPSDKIVNVINPHLKASKSKMYNDVLYTFYTYSGQMTINDIAQEYELNLPASDHFRIVHLKIGSSTSDFYGVVPIKFKVNNE